MRSDQRPQPQAFDQCLRYARLTPGHFSRWRLLCGTIAFSGLALSQAALAQIAPVQTAPAKTGPAKTGPVQLTPSTVATNTDATEQVRFEADSLLYDDKAQIVTANGNVIMRRADQSVRADAVTWNRTTGAIEAQGNIRLVDADGNVLYTDKLELTDELKAGATEDLLLALREGGRLAARSATRDARGDMVLHNGVYTGCAVEDDSGCPKRPSWEITAVRVTYRASDKRVRYYGAKLRVFGIDLLPLPGLGHTADFRAESGLLIPSFRLGSNNGVEVSDTYYLRLADNKDLALTGTVFTKALPMLQAHYRQLAKNGAFEVTGYVTQSRKIDVATGLTSTTGSSAFRGYFEANGRFQFDENWSLTGYGRVASDRTFLRRYDISRDDRLRSSLNLERIDNDSYFSLAGWAVQTLRVGDRQGLVPIALPSLEYRRRTEIPGIDGKLELELNTLALTRTAGQDTQRGFGRAQWDLHQLTPWGQEVTFTALLRGDLYHSAQNALTTTDIYRGTPGWQARGIATAAIDVKWPLIGELFGGTQVFTPHVQIVATPHVRNLDIPNEDSRSTELETANLFTLNRFPGYDRYEDGLRFTYGFDWRLDRPGWRVSTTVGQSRRLSSQNGLIPAGTGLSNRSSDIVGRTELRFGDVVKFTHRFRLDKDTFKLRRNEVDATIGNHRTYAEIGYMRLSRDIDTTFEDLRDRQELRFSARVAFARYWSVFGSGVTNLTPRSADPTNLSNGFQMLRHRLGFAYTDDCFDLSLTWRRDYVTTGDAYKGNAYLLSIAFRNIGTK
ncbi:LPS-assembly protein LptD [Novosphingobium sp. FKTRR1]|uniref:LPS-assembly protein LptD n=1 Tax=Novosphingobium sp. FKTRR1 TaxID=2879118 RepID=UPI001CEFC544|nr:LPS assembly protein LptD [Novosphingobium sp. FKTRR1]